MKKTINGIIKILKEDPLGWETVVSSFDDEGYSDYDDCKIINSVSRWYLGRLKRKHVDEIFKSAQDDYEYEYEGEDKMDFIVEVLFEEILDEAFDEYKKRKC